MPKPLRLPGSCAPKGRSSTFAELTKPPSADATTRLGRQRVRSVILGAASQTRAAVSGASPVESEPRVGYRICSARVLAARKRSIERANAARSFMTIQGWLEILVTLCLVVLAAQACRRFHGWSFRGKAHFLSPLRCAPSNAAFIGSPGSTNRGAGLAQLHAVDDPLHRALLRRALCDPSPSGQSAAQPARFWPRPARPRLQHRDQLHHQRQLAGLWRRNDAEPFFANGRPHRAEHARFRGGNRHRSRAYRARSRRREAETIGNFWVDVTRATLYVLLPLSIVVALAFVAHGRPSDACRPAST